MREVEREDDDREEQAADDPFPGPVREAFGLPVAPAGVRSDPDRRPDHHEQDCWAHAVMGDRPPMAVIQRFAPATDERDRLAGPVRPRPGWGARMAFRYELKTADGDDAGSYESIRGDWRAG